MDFALSDEHRLLADSAQQFLTQKYPLDGVPSIVDDEPGWDPSAWSQIADLGWLDDELTLLDHALLVEEAGAVLLAAPLYSTLALTWAARTPRSQSTAESGPLASTLAWAETGLPYAITGTDGYHTSLDPAGRVTGRKVLVPDADKVDELVVVAVGSAGPVLCQVRASDTIVRRRATSDRSRSMAEVEFRDVPSTTLVEPEGVVRALTQTQHRASVLAAAESLGVGRAALKLGVNHARERVQFGKPIGTYQAVSHRLADSYVSLELARSLTYWAAGCVESDDPSAGAACAAAKTAAATAAVEACESAIQVSGGTGITWEHILHRLYKRAQWLESFEAGSGELHARIAHHIL
ncbi:acyl-CoA dehydrogenase family protein [Rhodococcus sp. NPDC057014]|uniref:acyl-CoA dehydrogenase family protein n=1 Tax=Rhodococcus sp. NPDC057014 TaxID=3346000 RepID=UPI0036303ACE